MNYKKKFHVLDLPATKVYILLEERIRNDLINKAIDKSNIIIKEKTRRKADKLGLILKIRSNKYGIKNCDYNSRIIFHWRKGEIFMPLWVLIELSNLIKDNTLNLDILEKRISSFKSYGSSTIVTGKNLFPLKLTPELVSIYFHLVGDGSFCEKKSTTTYAQLDILTKKYFLDKLNKAFGRSNLSPKFNSKYDMIVPTIFTTLITSILKPNCYMSKKARIPETVKKLPKLYKFAGIVAYLLDEGHIGDSMSISSVNKLFLKDLTVLLEDLDYKTIFRTYHQKGTPVHFIYFRNKDIPRFYNDYQSLIKNHKSCNLSNKEIFLRLFVDVTKQKRGNSYKKEKIIMIKKNIIKILKINNKKTNEIRCLLYQKYKLALSYTALFHFLFKLEKENLIKHENVCLSKYSWSLNQLK